MPYELFYDPVFEKQVKKLDQPLQRQVLRKVAELVGNPFIGKPLSYGLKNHRSLRVGVYRVLYLIKGNQVVVAEVEHRGKAYYYLHELSDET